MFGFLKRKKRNDERDLEQLIFDIAEYRRDADFDVLYKMMADREVFVGIDSASLPESIVPGVRYTTQAADQVKMTSIVIPDHGEWSSAATLTSHPSVVSGYLGMRWIDFLNMTLKVPQLRGAALQGAKSWVAFDKERIRYILLIAAA